MSRLSFAVGVVFMLSGLAGCREPGTGTAIGTIGGAATGAAIGSTAGDAGKGALIGAGIGAVGGYLYDSSSSNADDRARGCGAGYYADRKGYCRPVNSANAGCGRGYYVDRKGYCRPY